MNKTQVIELISGKLKVIRAESGYSQERMAEILGISKKTLVQIEKGRDQAGWGVVVATCAMFKDSQILQSTLGDDPLDVIATIAHKHIDRPKEKTMGGKVWWREVINEGTFQIQQNLISQHYRILDDEGYRWYSSFDKDETIARMRELNNSR